MTEPVTNSSDHGGAAADRGSSGGPEPLLAVRDLVTWFPIKSGFFRRTVGHVHAVDGVSLSLERGKTLALVGESGCGKTTVGRTILQLLRPTSGSVRFAGAELVGLDERELLPFRRRMQMVFQDPMTALDPRMRVGEIVAEGIEAFGLAGSKSELDDRVRLALGQVKLSPDHVNRFPHEFSGGQRQRIGIARALAVGPELLVCDEAVSALDVSIQAQVLNLLAELQAELGVAYLFITHDLSVVRHLAHEVAVMYLGQVVEHAPTERLFREPAHPYTRGLLAAVPSADPLAPRISAGVLGDVPSPAHPPSGCRFHTRCPVRIERCLTEVPREVVRSGARVRCHLALDVGTVGSGEPAS